MKKPFTPRMLATLAAIGLAVTVSAQVKPDNSAVNKGDAGKAAATADQQSNKRPDVETTRKIRRAIMADKSLSTYAHNVKIITQHGHVTLHGPVRSSAEKEAVTAKAAEVAGAANITSTISIVPAKSRKSTH